MEKNTGSEQQNGDVYIWKKNGISPLAMLMLQASKISKDLKKNLKLVFFWHSTWIRNLERPKKMDVNGQRVVDKLWDFRGFPLPAAGSLYPRLEPGRPRLGDDWIDG